MRSRRTARPPGFVQVVGGLLCLAGRASAQAPASELAPFIAINEPGVVLQHVRVIDGTGAAARDDQTVVIASGRITAVGPAASTPVPAGAKSYDYPGYTVVPCSNYHTSNCLCRNLI